MKPFNPEDVRAKLKSHSGWHFHNNQLEKKFQFTDFSEAFAFMTRVAFIAEKLNHHPDWTNIYNQVVIRLSTHDAGGITNKDFEFAQQADGLQATN